MNTHSMLAGLKQAAVANTLRGCRLLSGLGAPDLDQIVAITVVKPLEKGDYLFREGDPSAGFYIVQRGAVNIHRVNAAGKEQIIHVFRAGESFAEATLATDAGYPADARALEPSQVLLVQKAGFVALLGASRSWACACWGRSVLTCAPWSARSKTSPSRTSKLVWPTGWSNGVRTRSPKSRW